MSICGWKSAPQIDPATFKGVCPAATLVKVIFFFLFLALPGIAQGQSDRQHIVYFQGTPQELEIYKI
jgi:hypothetical protein